MYEISCLPPELLREVLSYLPIQSLLAFGQTSKYHHAVQQTSLSNLGLGVFPTRLDGLLSSMEMIGIHDKTHNVQNVLEKRKTRSKNAIFFNQNLTIARIVHRYAKSLRDLEISIWDLQQSGAEALAKVDGVRRLSIRLDHPSTRCADLDPSFWCHSPGSTVWNTFYARHDTPKVFGHLRSLNLERAGITDYQLLQILESNPKIAELTLRKCLTLTDELFRGLSRSRISKQLKVLHFTQTENARIDGRILKYISGMSSLEVQFPSIEIDTKSLTRP